MAKTSLRLPSFLLPFPTVISARPLSLSARKCIPMSETLEQPPNPGVERLYRDEHDDLISFGLEIKTSQMLHHKRGV